MMTWAKAIFLLAVLPVTVLSQRPSVDYEYVDVDEAAPFSQGSFQARPSLAPQAAAPQAAIPQGAVPARSVPAKAAATQTSLPVKGREPTRDPQEEKPEPITILQQINEHNEDGSYTYGYEGSDGSFKLETRFPDGRVQGKYGYIDIESGKLKVIEYGADAMGFQPVGDLPEGIVVPPPVLGNDTSDGTEETFNDGQFVPSPQPTVHNRARQEGGSRALPGNPSQNRGQDFQQHPSAASPAPQTRTPQLVVEQPFEEVQPSRSPVADPASFSRFQPDGTQFQASPQPAPQQAPQVRPQQAQANFQSFEPAAPRPQPQAAPASFQAFEAQPQQSFSQETHFEERPQQVVNSVPATPAPARPLQAAPAAPVATRPQPQPAFAQEAQFQPSPQPQGPFTSFPANDAPVRQGRFPSEQDSFEGSDFPEVVRTESDSFRQPAAVAQEPRVEDPEAPAAAPFNPNRARVRQQAPSRQAPAPLRPQPEQQAPVPAPVRAVARPEPEPQAPIPARVLARPQPEQSSIPVRALARPQQEQPATQPTRQAAAPTRQPLSRGQHITQPQQDQTEFRGSDSDGEQFHAPIESSGPPPQFDSFPIQGSQPQSSQNRFQAAPSQPSLQPAPVRTAAPIQAAPSFQEVELDSFRPEEEPQAAPVRIKARPQEAAPQPQRPQQQPPQNFQFQQQFQQPPQQQQQQPPQQFQSFQAQPNFQQSGQNFQLQQQQSSSNFDNLVKEFTVQNRAGRSEHDFPQLVELESPQQDQQQQSLPQQVFRFHPVPAVPNKYR